MTLRAPPARRTLPSVTSDLLTSRATASGGASYVRPRSAFVALALVALSGCAGGGPLLHPAQTLGRGEVQATTGLSGTAVVGDLGSGLNAALNDAAKTNGTTVDSTFAKGAIVSAVAAPGVAPFLAARVGLPAQFEGGLAYTGRSLRVDVRRAFVFGENDAWALSVGAGGSAALYGRQQGSPLPGVDLSELRGWGADVPLLVGWRSDGGLFMFWAGPRVGWEHDTIEYVTGESIADEPGPMLTADRYWAGGVLGAAAGFRHVHVALELDAQYETISGRYMGVYGKVDGVAITPAGAVWWTF